MLENKSYSITQLEEMLQTHGKQNIEGKLNRYGIDYISKGRGKSRVVLCQDLVQVKMRFSPS